MFVCVYVGVYVWACGSVWEVVCMGGLGVGVAVRVCVGVFLERMCIEFLRTHKALE